MNTLFRHVRKFSTNSFVVSEEVREALKAGSAVVALESTVITHGLPYPENIGFVLFRLRFTFPFFITCNIVHVMVVRLLVCVSGSNAIRVERTRKLLKRNTR